jgi:membrane-bound acyltransferase YfiQ involved in biofilm formation
VPRAASASARGIPMGVRRRARRLAWVYLIVALGLIVWTVFLALSLPKQNIEHHYRLTWVGFDLILALAIYMTAYLAFRLDARVLVPATVVATLLVVDAWFDVTTSTNSNAATQALILALAVELPAAAFSLYVAYRVGRRVRELANLDRVTAPDTQASDQAETRTACPPECSTPVELPPEE